MTWTPELFLWAVVAIFLSSVANLGAVFIVRALRRKNFASFRLLGFICMAGALCFFSFASITVTVFLALAILCIATIQFWQERSQSLKWIDAAATVGMTAIAQLVGFLLTFLVLLNVPGFLSSPFHYLMAPLDPDQTEFLIYLFFGVYVFFVMLVSFLRPTLSAFRHWVFSAGQNEFHREGADFVSPQF